ncbi:LptA/OstA family protein [Phenylobacterium sp.]|uniref:LptA/OstA family protein n=1 Tax=Phenylobacterium sp. TaxID=1871053 RepID=UPI003D286EE6
MTSFRSVSVFAPSCLGLALLGAVLLSGPVMAKGLGPSSDGPIDITADELEVQNKTCISTWRGKAEALQGDARLRADMLKAILEVKASAPGQSAGGTGACGEMVRMEATGNVYYVTAKNQRVRGDAGVYDVQAETVTLTGDVVAVQDENVLRGSRMVFNTATGEGRMVGGGAGANSKNRPRGVFYPSKKSESPKK